MRSPRCAAIMPVFFAVIIYVVPTLAQRKDSRRRTFDDQQRAKKPNLIVIMTDDQDSELGSMKYMPKARRIMEEGGAHFINAFTNSPICCPSRSTFLTGLHVHNHNVWTNKDNCSSTYWQQMFETRSFGTYLRNAGYETGYFGKYLNEYDGNHIPPGWKQWMGQIKNSAFYNYTVNFNGQLIKHGANYQKDYFTDLIANDSIAFFRQSKQLDPTKPVAMVLAMPAPHGPEDSAPQYSHLFLNASEHRTPTWNYAPNPDKEYLLQMTGKMEPIQVRFTNLLHSKRLQTLQSVDDAVEKVYNELENLEELDNTYIIYLSDHGYHLGQFGVIKGKSTPYEFDIRIPMYIRGPGIRPGIRVSNLVGIIDVAPTLLDLGGVAVPDHMDGKSMKALLEVENNDADGIIKKKAWRDTFLIERGKVRPSLVDEDVMTENIPIFFTKMGLLEDKCAKSRYQYPCRAGQKGYCHKDDKGRLSIRECNKLTKSCSCKQRRVKRYPDNSLNQKCSNVDGTVRCIAVKASGSTPWRNQKEALDELIEKYKDQLHKLKSLKKDLRQNFEKVDFSKYLPDELKPNDTGLLTTPPQSVVFNGAPFQAAQYQDGEAEEGTEDRAEPQEGPTETECFCIEEGFESNHDDYGMEYEGTDDENGEGGGNNQEQETKVRKGKKKERRTCDEQDQSCLRRLRRKYLRQTSSKKNSALCQVDGLECVVMDNDHWKTEPKWTYGPFCYCNNAQSNVFWCLRTINETHNFLYCEYMNGFISYFDINADPWQFRNAVSDLSYGQLGQLHTLLIRVRGCQGAKECNHRYRERSSLETLADDKVNAP